MRGFKRPGQAILGVGLVLSLVWLVCCQSSEPRDTPALQPEPEPVPVEEQPAPTGEAAEASKDDSAAAEEKEKLPEYIQVLAAYDASENAYANVVLTPPRRIAIDTHNVRILRIDRDKLPLDARRSIVLQIDGQGIEWKASSEVQVFERSINGVWSAAKDQSP